MAFRQHLLVLPIAMLFSAMALLLTVCTVDAAVQVTLPYTLAVFFVRDLATNAHSSEEYVGRLTGLLVPALLRSALIPCSDLYMYI